MRRWLPLAMAGAMMVPALAQVPDPAFKRLPAFCLADAQGIEGDTYPEAVGKIDDSLDDTNPGPTCALTDVLTPKLNALRDRLAQCQARAGAGSLASRFAADIGKVDGMTSHVRAARASVRCTG